MLSLSFPDRGGRRAPVGGRERDRGIIIAHNPKIRIAQPEITYGTLFKFPTKYRISKQTIFATFGSNIRRNIGAIRASGNFFYSKNVRVRETCKTGDFLQLLRGKKTGAKSGNGKTRRIKGRRRETVRRFAQKEGLFFYANSCKISNNRG